MYTVYMSTYLDFKIIVDRFFLKLKIRGILHSGAVCFHGFSGDLVW